MERIEYIDVAKFIGLFLVCFCHIPMPEGYFHIWVYSFHMPMFFLASGLFFKFQNKCNKEVTRLLLPYMLFNILGIVILVLRNYIFGGYIGIPKEVYEKLFWGCNILGPSWFVLSLFMIRLICIYLYRFGGCKLLIIFTVLILLLFIMFKDILLWKFLRMGTIPLSMPFFLFGYFFKKKILENIDYGGFGVTLILLILSLSSLLNGLVGIHALDFGKNIFLFYIGGISGTLLLFRVSRFIKIQHKILDTFMQGAIFYICMHTLMFEYIILLWNKFTNDFSGNTIIEKIVITILTFVISYPMIKFMLKYTPFLLGKRIRK